MTGLALAGSGLSLEQSSGGGSASNGFPITSGQSGVVSSGGEILVLSGGQIIINAGGSETISGTETIASGGLLIVAAGGSQTVSGTETIASGGTLVVASGATERISSGGVVSVLAGGSAVVAGTETIASGGTVNVASGGAETIASGGSVTFSAGAVFSVASGAVISSGTAQALLNAEGSAGLGPLGPGGFATGRWYGGPLNATQASNINAASGTLYATFFYVPLATSFSALGSWINTSTTANLLWGVYGPITPTQQAASLSGVPLFGATTSVAIASTSATHSAAFTSSLPAGWYATVVMGDAAYSAGNAAGSLAQGLAFYNIGATSATPGNFALAGYTAAGVVFSNGMPANLPVMTAVAGNALVGVSWLK